MMVVYTIISTICVVSQFNGKKMDRSAKPAVFRI